ncbi:MAG TPA: SDR family NAD(P)-dependent oxidoreductase, partial [Bacillota bacterium]|nr:SDR family NAD(P)-dependent oxidoreductase [Bacillota bacterium]
MQDKLFDVSGKVAVITGGGGILCSQMAESLAERGVKVAILDLRAEAADAVAARICEKCGTAKGYAVNVLDKASV